MFLTYSINISWLLLPQQNNNENDIRICCNWMIDSIYGMIDSVKINDFLPTWESWNIANNIYFHGYNVI